jgi:hypothetical protein
MDTDVANGKTASAGSLFTPKADITVYELAKVIEAVLNSQSAVFTPELFDTLPADVQRHFTEQPSVVVKKNFLSLLGL